MTEMTATESQISEIEQKRFRPQPTQALDELNLAEFPLALLSDRVPEGCTTLRFQDRVFDKSKQDYVTRSLVVSASAEYGLPTGKDEEVLLALIHLTDRVNGFQDPTVHFTRYELLKLMGWNQGAKSYRRLLDSMIRWKTVTLNYKNAWRRKDSWMSEVFSLIDNITICEAEQMQQARKGSKQSDLPLSSFKWNRVFFESLQARHVKGLDYDFFQQLRTPTARRMYRFLDKRFGVGRSEWNFDLHNFAFEHVGLTRSYHTGKIKEKLQPAISELEDKGYLVPQTKEQRYTKHGKTWKVCFAQSQSETPVCETIVQKLINCGVSRKTAESLSREFDEETIDHRIEVFRWIQEHQPESIRSPAGYLTDSIRNEYQIPPGFQTQEQQEAGARLREEQEAQRTAKKQEEAQRNEALRRERQHVADLIESLSAEELKDVKHEAVAGASDEERQALASPVTRDLQLDLLVSRLLLERFPPRADSA